MSGAEFDVGSDTDTVIGWDIGGAHVKACLRVDGAVRDVAQWACPLWQGLQHLDAALADAQRRWPQWLGSAAHAVTMTGEMVDLFTDREDGVRRISALLAQRLGGPVWIYAGPGQWVAPADAAAHWPQIASANWRATAQHAAAVLGRGLLIDIGSTTTDLIAFDRGQVLGNSVSDRHRLASGELVYQGVVRTPLCALAPRIVLQGEVLNVMNEFFATTADVYRLSGELDPAHDLYPSADNADKGLPATRARLARMVGCDVRDASAAEWLAFAHAWRAAQLDELAGQALRVLQRHDLDPAGLRVVAAGCGAFLVPELMALIRRRGGHHETRESVNDCIDYGHAVARIEAGAGHDERARWARVCAPSVAVATLYRPGRQPKSPEVR
ncbi:H4MPT-linked C1 transfer pathway protein [Leptothrix cholodnii SP-6]|uniref:H4MPT-linked C1 transfer pathway protein n=1 Tax=Leptothrix cholodnii (strain ATCC 51168 / LMG 8142 / SP-6) TaxID=395495 RepID=B1Y0Y2_LEPCP|nr:hydantoinase/oxoprolinase family protein [Leptothrix cholodnii]ACB35399.1 H4MPT-linked C1 transfer pathway protein [Leptothrix cholodnii SP-6]